MQFRAPGSAGHRHPNRDTHIQIPQSGSHSTAWHRHTVRTPPRTARDGDKSHLLPASAMLTFKGSGLEVRVPTPTRAIAGPASASPALLSFQGGSVRAPRAALRAPRRWPSLCISHGLSSKAPNRCRFGRAGHAQSSFDHRSTKTRRIRRCRGLKGGQALCRTIASGWPVEWSIGNGPQAGV